jgi:NitT/TauT family transport system substrate-binding protein
MKKIISILLLLTLSLALLASCSDITDNVYDDNDKPQNGASNIRVAVLNGTTGFGMAQLMESNANKTSTNNYTFSVETNAADINAQLINGSIDIAALPTNAAAALYNKKPNVDITLLAINTLGVLYVTENGNTITDISKLEGKTIYCPAQNPAFILQHILNKNNINATVDTTYSAPADLNAAVASGELGEHYIAVLPEPVLTTALKKNSSLRVALDLTEEWNKVEDTQLVQGCVVVRTEFLNSNPNAVKSFLAEYKASIEYLQNNVEGAAKLVVKYGIFQNEAVAKTAIPKCNVVYMDGEEMKAAMSGFVSAMPLNSIGGAIPDDDFYYISK